MANIGYVRVSTLEQNTVRQLDGVSLDKVFEEHISGVAVKRPILEECLAYLREGDTLHVDSIDRLARNAISLETLLNSLTSRGVSVHFHTEKLMFTNDDSSEQLLLFRMMNAFAQFERANMKERQRAGIAKAKAAGRHLGRPAKISPEFRQIIFEEFNKGVSVETLAKRFGVSASLIYKIGKKYYG